MNGGVSWRLASLQQSQSPLDAIVVGQRYRQPAEAEIEEMLNSVERDGLLTPIGVRPDGGTYRLVYGATRLAAVKKLGWPDILAVVLEGGSEEFEAAELVENLQRRHLERAERDELTKKLYELRTAEEQVGAGEELRDSLSRNSSGEPKAHARAKVEGAKRGRPVTAEARAKKEIAAQTGQSVRSVQRATSTRANDEFAPKKKSVDRDDDRLRRMDAINHHVEEISKLLASFDRTDGDMIRRNNQPYLDGWFGADGKLRSGCAADEGSPAAAPSFAPAPLDDAAAANLN